MKYASRAMLDAPLGKIDLENWFVHLSEYYLVGPVVDTIRTTS